MTLPRSFACLFDIISYTKKTRGSDKKALREKEVVGTRLCKSKGRRDSTIQLSKYSLKEVKESDVQNINRFIGRIILVIIIFSFIPSFVFGESERVFNRMDEKNIKKGIINTNITILPQLNKLNFGFIKNADSEYLFIKTVDKIFFQDEAIEAKVSDIIFKDTTISLVLSHPILGYGNIKFIFDKDAHITVEKTTNILLNTLNNENHQFVFCDPRSKVFHLYTSNHLPDPKHSIRMRKEEAESKGYKKCEFCFKKIMYMPEILLERAIGREMLLRIPINQPLLNDNVKQSYLKELGNKVLKNWPFKLIGYNYSFNILDSSNLKTYAIPTGNVFISSAIFDTLENEEELEAILVREIAHIEKRHALQQYYNTKKQIQAQQGLAAAAGVMAGFSALHSNSNSTWAFLSLSAMLAAMSHSIQIFGYQEKFDIEANDISALYFDIYQRDKYNLESVLNKLYFNELCLQLHAGLNKQKHTEIKKRIKRIYKKKYLVFKKNNNFVHRRKSKSPIQLDLEFQSIFEKKNKLGIYIYDRSILNFYKDEDGDTEIEIKLKDKNGNHTFYLNDNFVAEDLWGAHLIAEKTSNNQNHRFLEDIDTIKVFILFRPKTGSRTDSENFLSEIFMFVRNH